MKAVVFDASYSASWFISDERSPEAERVFERVLRGRLTGWVPGLWFYEIANALVQACNRKRLSGNGVEDAWGVMLALPLEVDQAEVAAMRRVSRLARQFELSAYDAAYLELADRLQVPLLTNDRELMNACRAQHVATHPDL